MTKIITSYLVYLNDQNWSRRSDIVLQSLSTLNQYADNGCEWYIVNNGGGDRTRNLILENLKDIDFEIIDLSNNFYDVAAHLTAYHYAVKRKEAYFAYFYDDFLFYDNCWSSDAIMMMDEHLDVGYMRLPAYVWGDRKYDTAFTPKSQNPDAVRHHVGLETNRNVTLDLFDRMGCHDFGVVDWQANSRPTLWRTDTFSDFIKDIEDVPVMQDLERLMIDYAANNRQIKSAFLDNGVCKTFHVNTSARTTSGINFSDIKIKKSDFFKMLEGLK
jgi:hypothetical protein